MQIKINELVSKVKTFNKKNADLDEKLGKALNNSLRHLKSYQSLKAKTKVYRGQLAQVLRVTNHVGPEDTYGGLRPFKRLRKMMS